MTTTSMMHSADSRHQDQSLPAENSLFQQIDNLETEASEAAHAEIMLRRAITTCDTSTTDQKPIEARTSRVPRHRGL